MPRIRFLRDYIYTPSAERRVSTKYKAGQAYLVNQECADQALMTGAAEHLVLKAPPRRRTRKTPSPAKSKAARPRRAKVIQP